MSTLSPKSSPYDLVTTQHPKEKSSSIVKYLSGWVSSRSRKGCKGKVKALFGVPLEYIHGTHLCQGGVPVVVRRCLDALKSPACLATPGVFRISGNHEEVQALRRLFEANKAPTTLLGRNTHVIAGVLKLYIRELPEPLITFDLYDALVALAPREGCTVDDARLTKLFQRLPPTHFNTLHQLLELLALVAINKDTNFMTAPNLGIVFAPTILRPRTESAARMAEDCAATIALTAHFISKHMKTQTGVMAIRPPMPPRRRTVLSKTKKSSSPPAEQSSHTTTHQTQSPRQPPRPPPRQPPLRARSTTTLRHHHPPKKPLAPKIFTLPKKKPISMPSKRNNSHSISGPAADSILQAARSFSSNRSRSSSTASRLSHSSTTTSTEAQQTVHRPPPPQPPRALRLSISPSISPLTRPEPRSAAGDSFSLSSTPLQPPRPPGRASPATRNTRGPRPPPFVDTSGLPLTRPLERWSCAEVVRWVSRLSIGPRLRPLFLNSGFDGDMLAHVTMHQLEHDLCIPSRVDRNLLLREIGMLKRR